MPVQHLEPFIDQAIRTLQQNLPAAITDVNARAAAAYPPPNDFAIDQIPVANFHFGGFGAVDYPMVEVAIPDWSMTAPSHGQGSWLLHEMLVVRIMAADALSPESLYRRVLRYAQATIAVLGARQAFGPSVVIDRQRGITGAYRFNPQTNEREEIVGGAVLLFHLEDSESIP